MIGNLGLTKAVHAEIDRALNDHELIKVRFPTKEKAEKKSLALEISTTHAAAFIQLVGNIATFYRKSDNT